MNAKPLTEPVEKQLQTPQGGFSYTLTRKRVRNLNLRVRTDGTVAVSAPPRMPQREIDAFLACKLGWVRRTQAAMLARPPAAPPLYTKQQSLALFTAVSDRIFPLFADLLGGQKPTLKVRDMKTRWGVCHAAKRTITLNLRLAEKPPEVIEYVVLHEYVHFLHQDHQAGFHAEMARLMPDYRARRRLLRQAAPPAQAPGGAGTN